MGKSVVYDFSGTGNFLEFGKSIERVTGRITTKFKAMDNQTKKTSRSLGVMGKTSEVVGNKMKALVLASGASVAASAKAFGDFESGLIDIQNLMSGDQLEQFGGQAEVLSQNAIKMGFSIADANKGLFDTVSALGSSEGSFESFEQAQRLAIAGSTDLSTAVDGMTTAIGIFGDEAGGAERIANSFFAAQVKGKVTVAGLARNMGKVGAAGKLAGFELDPLLAAVAAITTKGFRAEVATTGLASGLNALLKPEKEAAKLMEENGIAFGATALQATSLQEVLTQIAFVAENNPDVMARMFPQEALKVMASMDSAGLKTMQGALDLMKTDQLGPAEAKKLATFNQAMGRTMGGIKVMAISIGEALAPALILIGEGLSIVTAGFNDLGKQEKTIAALTFVGLLLFGGLAIAIGWIPAAITVAVAAVGALLAVFASKKDAIEAWLEGMRTRVRNFFTIGSLDTEISGAVSGEVGATISGVESTPTKNTLNGTIKIEANPGSAITSTKVASSNPGLNVQTQNSEIF